MITGFSPPTFLITFGLLNCVGGGCICSTYHQVLYVFVPPIVGVGWSELDREEGKKGKKEGGNKGREKGSTVIVMVVGPLAEGVLFGCGRKRNGERG